MSKKGYSWGAAGQVEGTGSAISIALDFKPRQVKLINIDGDVMLDWFEDMGAGKGFKISGQKITTESVVITDNNDAASAGVAVYLHSKDGRNGWLEFVSPTNADGTGTLSNGGSGYFIFDSDAAATDGVAIYCDEDGSDVLQCVSPSGKDIYVPVAGSNELIKIAHNADAASNGVQIYFDEDAATTYGRLQFVSPTNANAASVTNSSFAGLSAPIGSEISSGGITVNGQSFSIGTDSDINVSGETIHWFAKKD